LQNWYRKRRYRFLARFDEKKFIGLVLVGLDMCQKGKKQGVNRGFYRCVAELVQEKLRLIWMERSSNGDIPRQKMGYKLTLVIEYPSLMLVAFLLHQGSPCDAKKEKNSQRRYKGYYGYKNYDMGVSRFKVISVTRKNFKIINCFNPKNPGQNSFPVLTREFKR